MRQPLRQRNARVLLDRREQRGEAVAARRRQVLGQADLGDVVGIGGEDLGGAAAGVHAQRQVDQARDDGRIADRGEVEPRRVARRHDPDHRLAAVQAVLVGLQRVRKRRQLAAEVDQVLVALGPVAEEGEFVGDRGLRVAGGGFEGEGGVVHGMVIHSAQVRLRGTLRSA